MTVPYIDFPLCQCSSWYRQLYKLHNTLTTKQDLVFNDSTRINKLKSSLIPSLRRESAIFNRIFLFLKMDIFHVFDLLLNLLMKQLRCQTETLQGRRRACFFDDVPQKGDVGDARARNC